ncbi:hypothetical protein GCM10011516_00130 [Sphingobacterium cellulitidis]|uniref:Uncharacterized protein n=1 Tax=Sphingobacterium cellulitidis TaxID=1768011 RepID=A0A8H9FVQ5_9SPHI|nr:hypothetical protein GCM10011516_00130 [Sphingobacterium soli]
MLNVLLFADIKVACFEGLGDMDLGGIELDFWNMDGGGEATMKEIKGLGLNSENAPAIQFSVSGAMENRRSII